MSFPDWIRILQVGFGIGMVIFVHEMGHFLAARWCGVRVDVFSLGFGPKLLSFQRGDTTYQLAAVPFGGYVRMAGEMPDGTGRGPAPDELGAKSVPQRFLIYSGGVIMNMVFALALFPIALSSGLSSATPIVTPVPGSPAWHAGIPAGSTVLTANGKEVFDWTHIPVEVAIGGSTPVELEILPKGAQRSRMVTLQPVRNEQRGFFMVGLAPAVNPDLELEVTPNGAAYLAGIRDGDQLVEVLNGLPGFSPEDQYRHAFGNGPMNLRVKRGEELLDILVEPARPESKSASVFGISPLENLIKDLRADSIPQQLGIEKEDRLLAVNGKPTYSSDDIFEAIAGAQGELEFELQRGSERLTLNAGELDSDQRVEFLESLALAQDESATSILVMPATGAAIAGLQSGDRVLTLDGQDMADWSSIQQQAQNAVSLKRPLEFRLERDGIKQQILASAAQRPVLDYGMDIAEARYIYRTHGVVNSVRAGALASWRFLSEAWLTLEKMFQQEVSPKNMGGIIAIGQVSYHWSAMGWTKLLFFLCMVSVNLAFLNVLPIPVLDGGHLFFLIVEGIKGSPVSERTMGYSQVVGVVLILSLMVYVTYNDILRLVS
ncbi:MAG: regulator of sigma E protease [Planctomycetota bacterium]|jgi:regulator of sigma E protease